jgi:hypothetical protein
MPIHHFVIIGVVGGLALRSRVLAFAPLEKTTVERDKYQVGSSHTSRMVKPPLLAFSAVRVGEASNFLQAALTIRGSVD